MCCHKEELRNLICVTSVLFAFTVCIPSNSLTEFYYVHLKFTAVSRRHEVYQKLL